MNIITIAQCPDYQAEDQAVAKEFMSPHNSDINNLSIAEITIPPGVEVLPHYHKASEEIYHIISGQGIMRIDDEKQNMQAGQAVSIIPGQWHSIHNPFSQPLIMIVTCAPAWSPEDQVFE